MIVVHLITQRDQPYGSTRLCCECCGLSIYTIQKDAENARWTDDETAFRALPDGYIRCDRQEEKHGNGHREAEEGK